MGRGSGRGPHGHRPATASTHPGGHKEEAIRKIVCLALGVVPAGSTFVSVQTSSTSQEEIRQLQQMIQQLQQRLDQLEQKTKSQEKKQKRMQKKVMESQRKSALDRINFTGNYRFEAHAIGASIPSHFDWMVLQNLLVNTMFYMGTTGMPPASLDDVNNFIAQNYASYLYFTQNLTCDQLRAAMAQFPPEMQQQLFGMLLPSTYVEGYDGDNDMQCLDCHAGEEHKIPGSGTVSPLGAFAPTPSGPDPGWEPWPGGRTKAARTQGTEAMPVPASEVTRARWHCRRRRSRASPSRRMAPRDPSRSPSLGAFSDWILISQLVQLQQILNVHTFQGLNVYQN